jgi:S1-C subfamily serine protease
LLISDNPASAPPRSVNTGPDGTREIKLPPGNYTVESDRPITFHGKSYQWTQSVDIVAGRDVTLDLTDKNAEIQGPSPAAPGAGATLEADPSFLLPQWRDSVVSLWTATTRASGFLIESNGLVATSQRSVGNAIAVEVQLTPSIKIPGNVVATDVDRDVAVLSIDPKAVASIRPIRLSCGAASKPIAGGDDVFTIGSPLHEETTMISGKVGYVEPHRVMSDLTIPTGAAGGPVFTARGDIVGLTSTVDENDSYSRGDSPIIRREDVCAAVAKADAKIKSDAPPPGIHLPVEPARPFPSDALKAAAEQRTGTLRPYQVSAPTFDVAFITPVLTYAAKAQQSSGRGSRAPESMQLLARPLLDFSNWSEYVDNFPPVLLVRVTPKLVEGFWTTVARGAARTQGVAIPPIKHFASGFLRLRALCGEEEVTPIHPFKMEQRISETDAIYEGLYVFDPGALGRQCSSVKIVLYSEKDPNKADTRVVDPAIVQQIWQDFAPYRAGIK